MLITWHGQYTIKIVSRNVTLLIDPHSSQTGLTPLRIKTDIVALSNPQNEAMSHLKSLTGDPVVIDTPGEYSLSHYTLYARGWHDEDDNERAFHRWHIEGITLLHLGALNRKLEDAELQELENTDIDILFLPVGGHDSLDVEKALKLLTTVEPKIVIPIHYQIPKLNIKLASVDQFAKEMGVDPKSTIPKLNIASGKLPPEGLETIILSP
jgi:L-ascorbate metabolism protein UlaG (beta-lactamase superfamily)